MFIKQTFGTWEEVKSVQVSQVLPNQTGKDVVTGCCHVATVKSYCHTVATKLEAIYCVHIRDGETMMYGDKTSSRKGLLWLSGYKRPHSVTESERESPRLNDEEKCNMNCISIVNCGVRHSCCFT